jgi:transcriptional regulator with XRE-family HTH domain
MNTINEKDGNEFTKETQQAVGKRINEVRTKLKMNQSDFGGPLGISHSTLSMIEKGNTNPGIGLLFKLQKIYDVSLEYLFNGSGNMFKTGPDGRPAEREPVEFVTTFEDVVWLANNSPLFKALITASAAQLYNDEESSIKRNIERFKEK